MYPAAPRIVRRRYTRPHHNRKVYRTGRPYNWTGMNGNISQIPKNRFNTYKSKQRGQYAPDRYMAKLCYYDPAVVVQNTGVAYGNVRYKMNSAYDVDPTLASTAMAGFNELAAIYVAYRVTAMKAHVTFANMEAFPFTVYITPLASGTDPGANSATAYDWIMAPYAQSSMIGSKGGNDTKTLKLYTKFKKLIGSTQYDYDDQYAAQTNADPILLLYFAVGVDAPGNQGMTVTNGVVCSVRLTLYTTFYRRRDLTT